MTSEPESQRESGQEAQRAPRKPRQSVVLCIVRAIKRCRNGSESQNKKPETAHQKNERMMAEWTRRVGKFTLALVGVSIVTAIIFWRQQVVMQKQLNEMVDEQRPWISVKITGTASLLQNVDGDLRLHVNYHLDNVGKLPATRVFFYATIVPETNAADFGDTIKAACTHFIEMMSKSATAAGITLFPSQTEDSAFGIDDVPISKFSASDMKPPVAAFVPVCTVYRFKGDGGIFHYTPAAYILVTPTSTGLVIVDINHLQTGGMAVEIRALAQGNLDPT
jgi:hypothetical protein